MNNDKCTSIICHNKIHCVYCRKCIHCCLCVPEELARKLVNAQNRISMLEDRVDHLEWICSLQHETYEYEVDWRNY